MYVVTTDIKERFVERQSLKVLENNILSQQYTNTRHIVIEPQKFCPGDTLAVFPPNSVENVDKIMERMN